MVKHSGHFKTWMKCRKHEQRGSIFYISRVFSNISEFNTRPRLLHLFYNIDNIYTHCEWWKTKHVFWNARRVLSKFNARLRLLYLLNKLCLLLQLVRFCRKPCYRNHRKRTRERGKRMLWQTSYFKMFQSKSSWII